MDPIIIAAIIGAVGAILAALITTLVKKKKVLSGKNRAKHPFIKYLKDEELNSLIDLFYSQLEKRHFKIFQGFNIVPFFIKPISIYI